jgi:PrtD family type I secretion system ABC transporter
VLTLPKPLRNSAMGGFVRQHARFFVASAAFSLVVNLALLVPALYMLQVYDRVLSTRSVETLVMLSVVTGGALGLMFVLDLLRARLLAVAAGVFDQRIGQRSLQRLLDGFDPTTAAQHSNALRDVGVLRGFFSGAGIVSLFDAPWMPIYIGVIFLFNPILGALALASACVLILLAWINERTTRAGVEQVQQLSRDAGHFIDGVVRHAEVVKAMGMAPAVSARWQVQTGDLQQRQLRTQRMAGLLASATKSFRQAVQVVMLGVSAWLVIEQKATPGVMVAVTVILGRALAPIEMLVAQWKHLVEARAAWYRLDALLDSHSLTATTVLPDPRGSVTLENLYYLRPGTQRAIISNVNLAIAAGEVLALVGPSGSGKSTLARLMLGLLTPQSGAVRLDGAELSQWAPSRLGPFVGYLPQEVALFAGTVAENIARLGAPDSAAVVAAAHAAHAHELIVRLPNGYDTQVGEGGQWLSGGQRQRVALARALYGQPRLVVLDEPNANLDNDGEQALTQAIQGLRERGTTVVLITQRTQILSVADRILVLNEGSIQRVGVRQDKNSGTGEISAGDSALHVVPSPP